MCVQSTPEGEQAPPLEFTTDETHIFAKSTHTDMDIVGCTVYYEPTPGPLTPEEAAKIDSYDDFSGDKVRACMRSRNAAKRPTSPQLTFTCSSPPPLDTGCCSMAMGDGAFV